MKTNEKVMKTNVKQLKRNSWVRISFVRKTRHWFFPNHKHFCMWINSNYIKDQYLEGQAIPEKRCLKLENVFDS